jgi:hypothetical protein
MGLTVRQSSSTMPAVVSWPSRRGPPSVRIRLKPIPASAETTAAGSARSVPAITTSAFSAARALRSAGALSVVITIVRACAGAPVNSAPDRSRSSSLVTTAIGGDGGRPSRSFRHDSRGRAGP